MQKDNSYSWDAKDYASHSKAQAGWAKELISKLKLAGNEAILDIGCGDGKVTAEIAALLPTGSIVGIDSSQKMIDLAKSTYAEDTYTNLIFHLLDARKLPYKEEFDIIFSNAALHWIIDHSPVLAGIERSLTPKGRILLQMGGKGNAADIISAMDEILCMPHWRKYFNRFEFPYGFHGIEQYSSWLAKTNLEPVRVELIPKIMSYKDKEGLKGWIRTTWLPYTSRVPKEKRDAFINELIEMYLSKHPPDRDGNIHVNMVRLEVEATKKGSLD